MSRKKRKEREFKASIRQLQTEDLILKLDNRYLNKTANVTVIPKNITQDTLLESLEHTETSITFAVGPAGTGKTYITTKKAIQALTPKPELMWDGGCNGGKGFEVSGSPNFDECNAACNKHSWCDKFVYDGAAKNCWVNDVQCS